MKKIFFYSVILFFISSQIITGDNAAAKIKAKSITQNNLWVSNHNTRDSKTLPYAQGEVLVKFKTGKLDLERYSGRVKAKSFALAKGLERKKDIWKSNISVLKTKGNESVEDVIERLKNDPDIEHIQPNYIYHIAAIDTNDTYKDLLWGLDDASDNDIDAPQAWNISEGEENEVIVAVIDTGVAYDHPDLAANMWDGSQCLDKNGEFLGECEHGFDFEDNDKFPMDTFGHGTHIAGAIGAVKNNGIGVIGVAPNIKIMAIKCGSKGTLNTADIINGINFAKYNGAKIINASWGGNYFDLELYNAINNFPGLVIAAAGNGGEDWIGDDNEITHTYPSDFDLGNIVSVAAIDKNNELGAFSNYGVISIDVGAPGVDIYSAYLDSDYRNMQGTSMAAPHAAGLAGLILGYKPELTSAKVKNAILATGDPLPSLSGKTVTGKRINAYNALLYVTPPVITNYALNGAENNASFNPNLGETVGIILNANKNVNWVSIKIENSSNSEIYKYYYPGDDCDGKSQCVKYWDGSLSSKDTLLLDGEYKIKVKIEDANKDVFDDYLSPYAIIIDRTQPDTAPPLLTEIDPIPAFTNDNTPEYTFSSTEAGAIAYSGGCASDTVNAIAGHNSITLTQMEDGTYSDCAITVTDLSGNISEPLIFSGFAIDTIPPALGDLVYTKKNGEATNISLTNNKYNLTIDSSEYPDFAENLNGAAYLNIDGADTEKAFDVNWIEATKAVGQLTYQDNAYFPSVGWYFAVNEGVEVTFAIGENNFEAAILDKAGNGTLISVKLITADTTAPIITLIGDNPLTQEAGVEYDEPGAAAIDDVDGDISADIAIGGNVDINTLGEYILTYNVSDYSGNQAAEITRTVNVKDTLPPVITLNGGDMKIYEGTQYLDPGATAYDTLDGGITQNIISDGEVNTAIPGDYYIKYNVTDNAGNAALEMSRTITVLPLGDAQAALSANTSVDASAPEIMVGSNISQNSTITVGSEIADARMNVRAITNGAKTKQVNFQNSITVNSKTSAGDVKLEIPKDTQIKADASWDSIINLPRIISNSSVTVTPDENHTATIASVIEIGANDLPLNLSKAIRILIAGNSGKHAGFSRAGAFTKITAACVEDSEEAGDELPEGGECKIDVGSDLMVWTKHFTKFIIYSQTENQPPSAPPSGGGGGGGINCAAPVTPIIIINNNETAAYDNKVILKLSAENMNHSYSPLTMIISNHSNFDGAQWIDFTNSTEWMLTEGNGNKTVYAKFRNRCRESSPASDKIELLIKQPDEALTHKATETTAELENKPSKIAPQPMMELFNQPIASSAQIDINLSKRLKGRFLLQTENRGSIWYVDAINFLRYRVTPENALGLFKKLSKGISDADLAKISISGSGQVQKSALAEKLRGELLLQVEQKGAIWYVDIEGYRHYVSFSNLMDLFRKLSLGINNENLYKIREGDLTANPSNGANAINSGKILGEQIDKNLAKRLSGKLLLQVEDKGNIWYVDTIENKRYHIALGGALSLFRKLSLGIKDADLMEIPPAGINDTGNMSLRNRLKGKLLLQVEQKGAIWYVDEKGFRHETTRHNLLEIFRKLAIGIKNDDLYKISMGILDEV